MPENLEPRIERIEASIEKLVDVVGGLAGIVKELAVDLKEFAERQKRLETAQLETTEKLNALVQIVDEWIRHNPRPGA
jgi:hypothetical protein